MKIITKFLALSACVFHTLKMCLQQQIYRVMQTLQAGAPQYPSAVEIALEMSASKLVPEDIQLSISSDGTSATVTVTMEPYSVARVCFSFLTK